MRLHLLLFVCCTFIFSSCVGEIDSALKNKTVTSEFNKTDIVFGGVSSLRAISHSRIEVYFPEATGGSGKYSYRVFFGGDPTPRVIASDVLNVDYKGELKFTLTGLDAARNYIVRIDVEDQVTKSYFTSSVTENTSTFSNNVTDFYGISDVTNVAGIDGTDSIKVRWTHAQCIDSSLCSDDSDPSRYEIIVLQNSAGANNSGGLTPSSFDDRDLTSADGRIVKNVNFSISDNANETIFRGLSPGTDYFVLVRAIHRGSVEDLNNPQLRGEMNLSYLKIRTLTLDDASDANFVPNLEINSLSGEDAATGFQAQWDSAVGVFDHYRLFYSADSSFNTGSNLDDCKQNPASLDNLSSVILCRKVSYDLNSVLIAGLLAQTDYKFIIVMCQTVKCENGKRRVADVVTRKTGGDSPDFPGISDIDEAKNVLEFGSLKIKFQGVDRSQNYIDGYDLRWKDNINSSSDIGTLVTSFLNRPTSDSLYYEDYSVDSSSITVRGIEYYSGETYCFNLQPFVYDSSGAKVLFSNTVWDCISNPEYQAPTNIEFGGLNVNRTSGDQVILNWDTPANGVYEEYELYYYIGANTGPWLDDAISSSPSRSYTKVVIPSSQTTYVIYGVPDGTVVNFGMLTNFNTDFGKFRSETNTNELVCTFNDGVNNDCAGGI